MSFNNFTLKEIYIFWCEECIQQFYFIRKCFTLYEDFVKRILNIPKCSTREKSLETFLKYGKFCSLQGRSLTNSDTVGHVIYRLHWSVKTWLNSAHTVKWRLLKTFQFWLVIHPCLCSNVYLQSKHEHVDHLANIILTKCLNLAKRTHTHWISIRVLVMNIFLTNYFLDCISRIIQFMLYRRGEKFIYTTNILNFK